MRAHCWAPTGTIRASAVVGSDGDGDDDGEAVVVVLEGVAVGEGVAERLVGAAVVGPGAAGDVLQPARDTAQTRATVPARTDMTRRTRPGYVPGSRAPEAGDAVVIRWPSCCGR